MLTVRQTRLFSQMYDDSFVRNLCASDVSEDCFNRFYTIVRFCVWLIGLFGKHYYVAVVLLGQIFTSNSQNIFTA